MRGKVEIHFILALVAVLCLPHTSFSQSILEEITVTAQRREQSLQDVSLSIQAFSGKELTRRGVVDYKDIVQIAPGVQVGQAGFTTNVYIRGVGDFSTNALQGAAKATNIDACHASENLNATFR